MHKNRFFAKKKIISEKIGKAHQGRVGRWRTGRGRVVRSGFVGSLHSGATWCWCSCPDHSGALCAVPGARGCYLASTRPAPALVMAGEVGPALALLLNARLLLLLVTLVVVEVAVVEGGLSPPDSSRDGTDFRHFPATTDERGEQSSRSELFHTFTFSF